MPTGGINNNNMQDYLELDNVIAVGAHHYCLRN